MLMLDHLNLTVRDFQESARWYRRVFGFAVVEQGLDEDGLPWGILRAGEALLCIYERPGRHSPDAEARDRFHVINHFGLRIRDRAAWERVVEAEKLPIDYGGPIRYPRSTSWYLADPTGHAIEVALWDAAGVAFPGDSGTPNALPM
jgi:catechol 2,3-dioxygenase-like lactoylglutathione lyase family enzyme